MKTKSMVNYGLLIVGTIGGVLLPVIAAIPHVMGCMFVCMQDVAVKRIKQEEGSVRLDTINLSPVDLMKSAVDIVRNFYSTPKVQPGVIPDNDCDEKVSGSINVDLSEEEKDELSNVNHVEVPPSGDDKEGEGVSPKPTASPKRGAKRSEVAQ